MSFESFSRCIFCDVESVRVREEYVKWEYMFNNVVSSACR
jgi:hypothetical protein